MSWLLAPPFDVAHAGAAGKESRGRLVVKMLRPQAAGKPFRCQPIAVEETGDAVGAPPSDGAVQEVWLVWAPYQVPPEPAHTTQQVPPVARVTRVTLPLDAEVATLTTEERDDGPST